MVDGRLPGAGLALLVATMLPAAGSASPLPQDVRVVWERPIRSARDAAGRPQVEPQLAVSRTDPAHWLAVAIRARAAGGWQDNRCVSFVSLDGGATWREHEFATPTCGDPWAEFVTDSIAVFAALGGSGAIAGFRSTDGGLTWRPVESDLGRGHDHPTLVVHDPTGSEPEVLYLISGRGRRDEGLVRWSVHVSRSTDLGRSFDEAVVAVPSNLNNNALKSAVLSDGTLVAAFLDFQRNVDGFTGGGMLERRRAWIYRSRDGGRTFSIPLFVTELCGPGRGFPELAADRSSVANPGNLYFVCMRGQGEAVIVTRSSDAGERWSDPVRVDSTRPGDHVGTPTLAVGPEGIVGVTWQSQVDGSGSDCLSLYFAASTDGGATFSRPVRVSSVAGCPAAPGNGNGWTSERWPFGGDYSGLAALADGRFAAVWADSRLGIYQLWSGLIQVEP